MIEISRVDDRDCENCKHYKLAGFTNGNEECYACESWNCEFESKEIVMKIQRKLLSKEQKDQICNKYEDCSRGCPLKFSLFGEKTCYKQIEGVEYAIKEFWNEEIEI